MCEGGVRTGCVVLDALESKAALRGVVGRIDQDRRARQARVGPHIAPHEVIGSISGLSAEEDRRTLTTLHALVVCIPALRERRAGNDDRRRCGLERKVDDLEVFLVVLRLGGICESEASEEKHTRTQTLLPTCSSISILTNASNAFSNSGGMSR